MTKVTSLLPFNIQTEHPKWEEFSPTLINTPKFKIPTLIALVFIPFQLPSIIKNIFQSMQYQDQEGLTISIGSLCEIPINTVSSIGILLSYGMIFNLLPMAFSIILLPTYISSLSICIIQGIFDSAALSKQIKFKKEFDFELLKKFKLIFEDTNIIKKNKIISSTLSYVTKNRKHLDNQYPNEIEEVITALKKVQIVPYLLLKKNNNFLRLKAFSTKVLIKNLSNFHTKYDSVSQQISLARRVRPWMAKQSYESALLILQQQSEEALTIGLDIMNNLYIQNMKKTIVHIIGISTLVLAGLSSLTLLIGVFSTIPFSIPFVLFLTASILGTIRIVSFSVFLDVQGWNVSIRNLCPHFIRKRTGNDLTNKKARLPNYVDRLKQYQKQSSLIVHTTLI